jgi:heme-degrading protein
VNISVVVCDELGHLIALNRMDGACATVNRRSIRKAVISASTGLPSGEVAVTVNHETVNAVAGEVSQQSTFGADYRFSEEARSRGAVVSMGRSPTSKTRSARALASPACKR